MAAIVAEPDTFTVMSSDFNTEILAIACYVCFNMAKFPPQFRNKIVNELSERAVLKIKDSSYCSWNVKVHDTEEGVIFFKEGWKQFLKDNSLDGKEKFEFLAIEYDGHMHFKIQPYVTIIIGASDAFSSGYNPYSLSEEFAESCKNPTFRVTLPYHRTLYFSSKFCKKHIPLEQYTFILKNSEGTSWTVKGLARKVCMRLEGGCRGGSMKGGLWDIA